MHSEFKEVQNTTILIVDDSNENLKLLGNSLKREGYSVLTALSGKQSLALAQNKQPDLIILDVMMPEMNGFETCIRLKKNSATIHIPVVFLTASDELESIKKGFEIGAVDYITKPFNPAELMVRISSHLKRKWAADQQKKELENLLHILRNTSTGITAPVFKLLKNVDLLTQNTYPEPFKSRINNIQTSGSEIMKFASGISELSKLQGPDVTMHSEAFTLKDLFKDLLGSQDFSRLNLISTPELISQTDLQKLYFGDLEKISKAFHHVITAIGRSGFRRLTLNVSETGFQHDKKLLSIEISGKEKAFETHSFKKILFPEKEIHLLLASELLRLVSGKINSTTGSETSMMIKIDLPLETEAGTDTIEETATRTENNEEVHFLSGLNILIAEDNELNQRFLENVLSRCGANISIANSGTQALEIINSKNFQLILLDINIPGMSGIEVCKKLRNEQAITCPIIAISGETEEKYVQECLAAGMNSFLHKPFTVDELLSHLLDELAKTKLKKMESKVTQQDHKIEAEEEVAAYSLERLEDLSNGDRTLMESWINNFKDLVSRAIHEISKMIEAGEYKTGTKIFHELNNYTTYFGIDLLREYLKDIPHIHKSLPTKDLVDHLVLIVDELKNIERYFKDLDLNKR